jgi:hypothetical protein
MYSQVIENESILQKLDEENEELRKQLEQLEKEENISNSNYTDYNNSNFISNDSVINNTLNIMKNEENKQNELKCDYDIFKKTKKK